MNMLKQVPLAAGSIYSIRDFLEFTERLDRFSFIFRNVNTVLIYFSFVNSFMDRIKKITEIPQLSKKLLPFMLQIRLVPNLWKISDGFRLQCVQNYVQAYVLIEKKSDFMELWIQKFRF